MMNCCVGLNDCQCFIEGFRWVLRVHLPEFLRISATNQFMLHNIVELIDEHAVSLRLESTRLACSEVSGIRNVSGEVIVEPDLNLSLRCEPNHLFVDGQRPLELMDCLESNQRLLENI